MAIKIVVIMVIKRSAAHRTVSCIVFCAGVAVKFMH